MSEVASTDHAEESSALPGMVSKLRIVGIIEGISTLALFGIAMPIRRIWGYDIAVTIVGTAHGALFILYALLAFFVMYKYNWRKILGLWMFMGAVIPFGPFVVDRKIPRWYRQHSPA